MGTMKTVMVAVMIVIVLAGKLRRKILNHSSRIQLFQQSSWTLLGVDYSGCCHLTLASMILVQMRRGQLGQVT
jgi:hypothetical protein